MTREHGATGENGVNPHREGADAVSAEKKQVLIDKKYRNGPGSSQILESIKNMDDAALVETISYERKRLNDLRKKRWRTAATSTLKPSGNRTASSNRF